MVYNINAIKHSSPNQFNNFASLFKLRAGGSGFRPHDGSNIVLFVRWLEPELLCLLLGPLGLNCLFSFAPVFLWHCVKHRMSQCVVAVEYSSLSLLALFVISLLSESIHR